MGTVVLEYPRRNVKEGMLFWGNTKFTVYVWDGSGSTEVIVAKASGSFAVDSLQFRLPEIGLEW
jgi:hypothetical protein